MVELEPQPQQQPALEDAGGEAGVTRLAADGSEEDRVVPADLGEHGVGQHLAGREVALGPQVVAGRLDLEPSGAATSRTFRASAVTSGPIPSPGMTARRSDEVESEKSLEGG